MAKRIPALTWRKTPRRHETDLAKVVRFLNEPDEWTERDQYMVEKRTSTLACEKGKVRFFARVHGNFGYETISGHEKRSTAEAACSKHRRLLQKA